MSRAVCSCCSVSVGTLAYLEIALEGVSICTDFHVIAVITANALLSPVLCTFCQSRFFAVIARARLLETGVFTGFVVAVVARNAPFFPVLKTRSTLRSNATIASTLALAALRGAIHEHSFWTAGAQFSSMLRTCITFSSGPAAVAFAFVHLALGTCSGIACCATAAVLSAVDRTGSTICSACVLATANLGRAFTVFTCVHELACIAA
jgi:hypothetical protein